jgi:uncharacterized protein
MRTYHIQVAAPEGLGSDVIGVKPGSNLDVDVVLESVSEGVLASGNVRGSAQGECVRCLDAMEWPLDVTFSELFVYPGRAVEQDDQEGADLPVVVEETVDLEGPVRDAVVLALPFGPLCREDCPGLCSGCGRPFAETGEHTHEVIDPRWSGLEELLQQGEEE